MLKIIGLPYVFLLPPHLPKPQTHPLPNRHKRRKNQIRFNPHIERQRFDAFVLNGLGAQDFGDLHLEAFLNAVVNAFGEGDDVAAEDSFQDGEAF